MAEAHFYHLETVTLEQTLPLLIERVLERGWHAVVQATSDERVEALDNLLWTYKEDSFVPHGTRKDGHPELQAVYLTTSAENPNGARVRLLVDGAEISDLEAYERAIFIFDGNDAAAVARARDQWKAAKAAGCGLFYWQRDKSGWQRKA